MASLFLSRYSFATARFNKYCCNSSGKTEQSFNALAFLIHRSNDRNFQNCHASTVRTVCRENSHNNNNNNNGIIIGPGRSCISCCCTASNSCRSANHHSNRTIFFTWKNSFSSTATTYASTTTTRKDSSKSAWLMVLGGLAGLGGLAVWWKSNKSDDSREDPLTMTVKRGVLATQRGQYQDAQELLHKALEMAHVKHKEKAIGDKELLLIQVNVFGLMAVAATKSGDFVTAEKLYKELASLYAMTSRDKEARTGLLYCVEKMEEKVKEQGGILEADTNTLALLGLSLQSLARFYMTKKESLKGIECYKRSLEIAREVYGANHPQALVVLNDLASAYVISKQFKEGVECYKEAVDRAEQSQDMGDSLVAFHYNLGETYILLRDFDMATSHCVRCVETAKSLGNSQLMRAGEQCLKDVQEEKAKFLSSKTQK